MPPYRCLLKTQIQIKPITISLMVKRVIDMSSKSHNRVLKNRNFYYKRLGQLLYTIFIGQLVYTGLNSRWAGSIKAGGSNFPKVFEVPATLFDCSLRKETCPVLSPATQGRHRNLNKSSFPMVLR